MNKGVFILLFFTSFACYSQDIVSIAKRYDGQKVGKGYCLDFVEKVMIEVFGEEKTYSQINLKENYYGKKIKRRDVVAGDMIMFDSVKTEDGKSFINHVAIVVSMNEDGSITILHQNVKGGIKNSKVVETKISNIISGEIFFSRIK